MSVPMLLMDEITVVVVDETGHHLDVARWSALVRETLGAAGATGPAETNVVFVDVDVMAELNREHMGGDGPTDVLSFPIDDDATDGPPGAPRLIGDIVVCVDVAASNAPTHAGTLDDEIALLLVHGSLHLLGHDHGTDADRDQMWGMERQLLGALWGDFTRDPWSDTE